MNYRGRIATGKYGGFTLTELLIAVVILSIGLLGVVSFQLQLVRSNQEALHSSIAAYLAAEAADRVRANLPGVDDNEYDLITEAGTDPGCIDSDTGCSASTLAKNDAYEWISTIEDRLPNGQGVICKDSTPDDGTGSADPQCDGKNGVNELSVFAVKIWWDDDRNPYTPNVAYRMGIVP
jgi:type IV pilus assembly protein PilV